MHFRQYFTRILDLKGQFPDLSLPCPSEKFTCHVLIRVTHKPFAALYIVPVFFLICLK